MAEQKFIDRIEDLRHNTHTRITDLQKNLCPMVKDVYLQYVLYYWYEGYKYNLWEDDTHVYATKEIPYCYDNELRNTTFIDTLDHLVAEEKVWPFLLFIDGVAIKWSDITIIHDYDYSYMKVGNYGPDYSFTVSMMVFPISGSKIRYGEDSSVITGKNAGKGFYFDSTGRRLENVEFAQNVAMRLEILDDNIYFKAVNYSSIDKYLQFEDLADGFVPTLDNIITFNSDRLFVNEGAKTVVSEESLNSAYGLFKLTGFNPKDIAWLILMYNTSHTKSKSYLYTKDIDKTSTITYLKDESSNQEVVSTLIDRFDFEHDVNKDYDTNIENAAKYITNYDYSLWKEAFLKDVPIKSYTYTGTEYKALADSKGYIHLSRKHSDFIQDVAMVFVNNKLYNYSIDITYTNNSINIPIFNIADDDRIEIVVFTQCNNTILDLDIPDNETSIYIHPSYNLDDCYIMCESCADPTYTVPESEEGRRQYIVEFTYETVDEGTYKITLENEYYYGKELKIVPKKQFRYYEFKQKDGQFKIILPTQFNYCHDADRYLIFVNGIKIDRTEYTITIMNKYRPFDSLVLYLSTILDAGDYVDIFYVPELLTEAYSLDQMPKNGIITLSEPDSYPKLYPFSKYTNMVFINGMKVNPLNIKDVDMNMMTINVDKYMRDSNGNIIYDGDNPKIAPYYIDSVYNVTIMEYLEGDKYIAGFLKGLYDQIPEGEEYDPSKIDFTETAADKWKLMINKLISTSDYSVESIAKIYGTIHALESSSASYKDNFAGLKSILYDVIVDYYLVRQEANTGEKFLMDFERGSWTPEEGSIDENIIKLITLFGVKDKLLDYVTTDDVADTDDVYSGKKFLSANM